MSVLGPNYQPLDEVQLPGSTSGIVDASTQEKEVAQRVHELIEEKAPFCLADSQEAQALIQHERYKDLSSSYMSAMMVLTVFAIAAVALIVFASSGSSAMNIGKIISGSVMGTVLVTALFLTLAKDKNNEKNIFSDRVLRDHPEAFKLLNMPLPEELKAKAKEYLALYTALENNRGKTSENEMDELSITLPPGSGTTSRITKKTIVLLIDYIDLFENSGLLHTKNDPRLKELREFLGALFVDKLKTETEKANLNRVIDSRIDALIELLNPSDS